MLHAVSACEQEALRGPHLPSAFDNERKHGRSDRLHAGKKPRAFGYRADRNAMASTTTHPTMTREATAPAVILALSFVV
jgi:hypothetical protein